MGRAQAAAARDLAELAEDPGNPRSIGDISGIVWNEATGQQARLEGGGTYAEVAQQRGADLTPREEPAAPAGGEETP